jgi:hypothetical protein
MEEYHKRMVDEAADLDSKLKKIDSFSDGAAFSTLHIRDQFLILEQAAYMRMYLTVLRQRIARQ